MLHILAYILTGFTLYMLAWFTQSMVKTLRSKEDRIRAEFIALRTRFELLQTQARNTSADLDSLRRSFGPLQDLVHSLEGMVYQLRGRVLPPIGVEDLDPIDVDRELEAVRALVAAAEPGRPATTYERLLNDD